MAVPSLKNECCCVPPPSSASLVQEDLRILLFFGTKQKSTEVLFCVFGIF